jgi:hypothetical protein
LTIVESLVRARTREHLVSGVVRGFATPQGVTTAVEMVHIWRLANGKIVEHRAVRDDLALVMQLGVVKSG